MEKFSIVNNNIICHIIVNFLILFYNKTFLQSIYSWQN